MDAKELLQLKVVETFLYYDEPLLFSAVSENDQLYLVLATTPHEGEDAWLYLPISAERLEDLKNGTIDTHSAFKKAEKPVLRLVEPDKVEEVAGSSLTDDELPAPGHIHLKGQV